VTPDSVTSSLKARARSLGFSSVGIARAAALENERTPLEEWLANGMHASMKWMEVRKDLRIDPLRLLPNARSVISVAMNYYTPQQHSGLPLTGKISRYAWGDDYHDIMKERLSALEAVLHELHPSSSSRSFVDSGPMMDKAWAVRSGIGWMGKHSNVITRTHGSWIFLGEIVTDAELSYDEPMNSYCGSCTACIDACPTNAITKPYVVDARRCISYWTIEHRGELDAEIANRLDGWIFGCDVCQDVCPWNRFRQESSEPSFRSRISNVSPALEDLVSMDAIEFARRFRGSPVKRTKNAGLARNARAVLESLTRGK
jgi:epoxyqueuosine reductase